MTRAEAVKYLKAMKDECNDTCHNVRYVTHEEALDMAIQALSQEPCDDSISRQAVLDQINCWIGSGEYRYTNATHYLTERVKHISSVTQKPIECDDAMSRAELIEILKGKIKTHRSTIEIADKLIPLIEQLPSVTQKGGNNNVENSTGCMGFNSNGNRNSTILHT